MDFSISEPGSESEFKIDQNIPIHGRTKRHKPYTYPFQHMNVGDSFYVPHKGPEDEFEKTRGKINSEARRFVRESEDEPKFQTRLVKQGYRCWRVA